MSSPFRPNQAGRAIARIRARTVLQAAPRTKAKPAITLITLLLAFALTLALGLQPTPASALSVTVTVAPQRWLVDQIGGELVSTQVMVPAGADPHTYEPRPSQLVMLASSRLYLTIGLPIEYAWAKRFQCINPNLAVISMDQGLKRLPMTAALPLTGDSNTGHHPGPACSDEHHQSNGLDPHVWTSPANMLHMAITVRDILMAQDPAHKAEYAAGCQSVSTRILALDGELRSLFTSLPQGKRHFIMYHPAWGYFARDYGLTQIPVEMEGKEPGLRALSGLIDYARAHRITTIFVQPQFSKKSAQTVAEAIGGTVFPADPLADDWEANIRSVAGAFRASMNNIQPR